MDLIYGKGFETEEIKEKGSVDVPRFFWRSGYREGGRTLTLHVSFWGDCYWEV